MEYPIICWVIQRIHMNCKIYTNIKCTKGWVEERKRELIRTKKRKKNTRKSDKIVNSTNEMKIYYAEYFIIQWSIGNWCTIKIRYNFKWLLFNNSITCYAYSCLWPLVLLTWKKSISVSMKLNQPHLSIHVCYQIFIFDLSEVYGICKSSCFNISHWSAQLNQFSSCNFPIRRTLSQKMKASCIL